MLSLLKAGSLTLLPQSAPGPGGDNTSTGHAGPALYSGQLTALLVRHNIGNSDGNFNEDFVLFGLLNLFLKQQI